jgi:uncharacterized membrane protein
MILTTELLFLLVLAAWALFRAYSGDIAGTEKPMEFAFINGVLRSRFFPPPDPWLSGYAISYYYFGYVMVGILIRLTGVDPAVGFNLAVALWYALTTIGAFGVVYDLVGLTTGRGGAGEQRSASRGAGERGSRGAGEKGRGIRYGLLGALFVGFLGNLEGLVELAYQRGLVPLSWIQWLDIKQLTDTPPSGGWTGGFWWWWHASRVVHDKDLLGQSIEVIDEFPFFSFLLGDLHPHVLALPFVLLAIGLAVNLLLGARDWVFGIGYWGSGASGSKPERKRHAAGIIPNTQYLILDFWRKLGSATGLGAPGIFLYAVVLGALAFLNTWDFPIYLVLTTLAFGAGLALRKEPSWAVAGRTVGAGAILGVLGVLFYLPFYLGFQSQAGGILPNLLFPTRFSQYFLMFGPLLVVAVGFLVFLGRQAPDSEKPWGGLVDRLLFWLMGLLSLSARGRQHRRRVLAVLLVALLGPLALVGLMTLGFALLPQGQAFVQRLLNEPAVHANVGDRTLGQLVLLVLRVRAASPWTHIVLADLIALTVGLLWTRLASSRVREWECEGGEDASTVAQQGSQRAVEDRPISQSTNLPSKEDVPPVTDLFAVLLIALALLLTFAVEFVYLKDFFGTRMNTVFKFYYQAWIMLALAAAYGLSRLAEKDAPAWLKWPAWLLAGVLVLGGLFYPLAATPSKANDFRGRPTLDGLAFLRNYNPADMAAIEWLRANVAPEAVVLEAPGGSYSPEGAERISMSTGNPTLLGWDFHEKQWRGTAYDKLVAGRSEAIDQIYRTAKSEELRKLLDQWGINYVYIGGLERQKYGISQAAQARFDRALKLVYDKDGVRIYAR